MKFAAEKGVVKSLPWKPLSRNVPELPLLIVTLSAFAGGSRVKSRVARRITFITAYQVALNSVLEFIGPSVYILPRRRRGRELFVWPDSIFVRSRGGETSP